MADLTNERYYWHGKHVGQKPEIHHLVDGEAVVTVIDAPPDGMGTKACERCGEEFYFDPDATASPPEVCFGCSWEQRFEDAERAVGPFTDLMAEAGLHYEVWHTGGGCMAVTVALGGPPHESSYAGTRFYAMVTDGDAFLPEVGDTVTVGIYDAEWDGYGDEQYLTVGDGDPAVVVNFLLLWAKRVENLDTATADELEAWGIDPGRRAGFGLAAGPEVEPA